MSPPTLDSSLPTIAEADLPLVTGGLSLDPSNPRYVAGRTLSHCVDDATERYNGTADMIEQSVKRAARKGGSPAAATLLKNAAFDGYVGEIRDCLAAYNRPAP